MPCGTRLECLRREHDAIDLDGPAAATLIGMPLLVGAALFGSFSMLATFAARNDEAEQLWAGLAIGSLVVVAAAAVAGIWGLVRWMGGAHARRQLTREMRALEDAAVPVPFMMITPEGDAAGGVSLTYRR
ncbi:MAG: hypothetical protein KF729_10765 [Sandaracinaceae bacterium]|nr:hypothetical protein [Sandaracinaceae bacterium]